MHASIKTELQKTINAYFEIFRIAFNPLKKTLCANFNFSGYLLQAVVIYVKSLSNLLPLQVIKLQTIFSVTL